METRSITKLKQHGVSIVPKNWYTSKVKYIGDYINGYAFKPEDWSSEGQPILRIQDLTNRNKFPNRYNGALPEKFLIKKNDLLISWSASLGIYCWEGEEAWLNQHIFKVKPNEEKISKSYFFWLAHWFIEEMQRDMHGSTMQHLTADAFGGFPVIIPDISQQKIISSFLKNKVNQIDKLILAKQKLFQLLLEKQKSLISNFILKGINPKETLKNSGIDWLGKIPKHWQIERSKWLLPPRDERSIDGQEELLTVSHKTGVTPRSEKSVNMFEAESKEGYKICYKGDLVINTLWAWMGAMGVAPMKGIVSPAYHVYRVNKERLLSEYIDALVRLPVFATEVTRYSKGVWMSRLRLYPEGLYEVYLPVPPLEEQKKIVAHIKQTTEKIDKLKAATEKSIQLLKERRTALIAAAVTGQLDITE